MHEWAVAGIGDGVGIELSVLGLSHLHELRQDVSVVHQTGCRAGGAAAVQIVFDRIQRVVDQVANIAGGIASGRPSAAASMATLLSP